MPSLAHIPLVESILHEKIFPEDCTPIPFEYFAKEPRVDIRHFAHRVVIDALQKIVGTRIHNPDIDLEPDEHAQLKTILGNDLRILSRHVAMANNIGRANFSLDESTTDEVTPRHQARAKFQGSMLQVFQAHAQTLPQNHADESRLPLSEQLRDGLLGIAPTGSGKTVIAARILRELGIAKPAGVDQTPLRALVVVPDQNLIKQYMGTNGDNTFRRFLGEDVRLSAVWEEEKDPSGDVVLVTRQSLPRAIDKNIIVPDDYDVSLIDEAHSTLGPVMSKCLGKLSTRLLCLTATPAYSPQRDLRKRISHVEIGSMRSFVEEGILNPVRLYTYRSQGNEIELATALAESYIKQGLKVVIFCRPKEQQPQKIIKLINHKQEKPVGKMVGSSLSESQNNYNLNQFTNGSIRCLATVAMLREGWNADVDVVITIGPNLSLLDLTQKAGRAMRPGKHHSILIEIQPEPKPKQELVSIWNVFGLDYVMQGELIGDPKVRICNNHHPIDISPNKYRTPIERSSSEIERDLHIEHDLPGFVHTARVPNAPLREIMIAPEDLRRHTPPDGYVALSSLAQQHNVNPKLLRVKLDNQNIPYVGIWPPGPLRDFERWYAPDAHEYLARHPVLQFAEQNLLHVKEISQLCGVSKDYIYNLITELGIEGEERLGTNYQRMTVFSAHQVEMIIEEVGKIPQAESNDVVYAPYAKMIGHSFARNWCEKNDVIPQEKRRHPTHGVKGFALHITKEEADQLRDAYDSIPNVTEEYMSYAQIAKQAHVSEETVRNSVSPEDRAYAQLMRQVGERVHIADYFPRKVAEMIIERLRPVPLPPHLAPSSLITARTGKHKATVTSWCEKNNYAPERIRIKGIVGPSISCYPWKAVEEFEAHFGRKKEYEPLKPELLIREPQDNNEEKWLYTQKIQSIYVPIEELPQPLLTSPETISLANLAAEMQCTATVMQEIFSLLGITKESFVQNDQNIFTHIRASEVDRIRRYHKQHTSFTHGHELVSSQRIIDITKASATKVLHQIRNQEASDDKIEFRRHVITNITDLYMNPRLANAVIAALKKKG